MERDVNTVDRARAHLRPDAQDVRKWALEQAIQRDAQGTASSTVQVIKEADKLATYALMGEVPSS